MYSIDSFNYSIASDKLPFLTEIQHFTKNNGYFKQFLTQFSFYCLQKYCPFWLFQVRRSFDYLGPIICDRKRHVLHLSQKIDCHWETPWNSLYPLFCWDNRSMCQDGDSEGWKHLESLSHSIEKRCPGECLRHLVDPWASVFTACQWWFEV